MHIYPHMTFDSLKKHLQEGNVTITYKSLSSDKIFTKTCTLQHTEQRIKINQRESNKIVVWLVDDNKFEDIELSSIDEIKID